MNELNRGVIVLKPKQLFLDWVNSADEEGKKQGLAVKLYRERKHPIDEICQMMGITKPTLYRYVRNET